MKEQTPGTYARMFAENGFVALAIDYARYGEGEGAPRQFESPATELCGLKAAVSCLTRLPYVQGVGMVGVCTSAGTATYLAAGDLRIKACATVAGFLRDAALFKMMLGEDGVATRRQAGAAAARKDKQTGDQTLIAAYSETDKAAANFAPVAGTSDYYLIPSRGNTPTYKNANAVMSGEHFLSVDPISNAPAINAPTMVVHSEGCVFPDQVKKFILCSRGRRNFVVDAARYSKRHQVR